MKNCIKCNAEIEDELNSVQNVEQHKTRKKNYRKKKKKLLRFVVVKAVARKFQVI